MHDLQIKKKKLNERYWVLYISDYSRHWKENDEKKKSSLLQHSYYIKVETDETWESLSYNVDNSPALDKTT